MTRLLEYGEDLGEPGAGPATIAVAVVVVVVAAAAVGVDRGPSLETSAADETADSWTESPTAAAAAAVVAVVVVVVVVVVEHSLSFLAALIAGTCHHTWSPAAAAAASVRIVAVEIVGTEETDQKQQRC